ncbi:SusD/RagB family nutrient-binding outer membrane lipoprotein [Aureibaculum sp. 2210JD6-5]|uniref:SusD/RagB family nutrient-binding outer membrane lipoprotein n=1 Tax=Aureibaculum sp. 2210JD6-5 TaxID=3103957 RepID=UPI002AAD5E75|nr:SusD/RagB family nutrient-binding outer membrane lipoprotein [Aureibaculum sp. 2210JD6-5]MDY7396817.1 SusD/RagB family nutrient-binding outer membrane lipoprotein [Aureibaculum sp. 2210JD6-5]
MKKHIRNFIYTTLIVSFISCDSYLDVNEDPNVATDVPPELIFKGMELADTQINAGHLMRISQFWTGQMKGVNSLYARINDYNISPEESNGVWAHMYHGIMTQNDIIQETSEDNLLKGMANVLEAHGIGSAAALFGDIPYSEVGNPVGAAFDGQVAIFQALQTLLDQAITQLEDVVPSRRFSDDIFLNGKSEAWIEVAYTLKARYYLMNRQYGEAYQSALNGISSNANSLKFAAAYGEYGSTLENSSLYNLILTGSRAGDLTTNGSYIQDELLSGASSRNNAKTNESRRRDYLILDQAAINEDRLSWASANMPLVTYEENLMILAETGLRTVDFAEGLTQLNKLRAFLATGNGFKGDSGLPIQYDAYDAADFATGGMENTDAISADKALLREIIEEKYVSTFGTIVPFDDFRRIRKTDADIAMPIPVNDGSTYPERFLIAQDEINGNPNVPSPIPDIFTVTPVNQ